MINGFFCTHLVRHDLVYLFLLLCQLAYLNESHQGFAKPLSSLNTYSLGYSKEKSSLNKAAYGTSQGGYVNLKFYLLPDHLSHVGVLLSYRFQKVTEQLTPEAMMLNTQDAVQMMTVLERPSQTLYELDLTQHVSMGLSWDSTKLLSDSEFSLHLSAGIFGDLVQEQRHLKPWGCLRLSYQWLWLEHSHLAEQCSGIRQASSRSLLGFYIGRAELGGGWGVAHQSWWSEGENGGFLAWLSLPLSAPLYLEMSFWLPKYSALSQEYYPREQWSDGSVFLVGLTWTGESEAPELDPPQQTPRIPQSPNAPNEPSSPSSQPLSPSLTPFSPNSPPPTSPTPETPL